MADFGESGTAEVDRRGRRDNTLLSSAFRGSGFSYKLAWQQNFRSKVCFVFQRFPFHLRANVCLHKIALREFAAFEIDATLYEKP